jgi:hypothetical protein
LEVVLWDVCVLVALLEFDGELVAVITLGVFDSEGVREGVLVPVEDEELVFDAEEEDKAVLEVEIVELTVIELDLVAEAVVDIELVLGMVGDCETDRVIDTVADSDIV